MALEVTVGPPVVTINHGNTFLGIVNLMDHRLT